jgi:rhomboid protease GluP
MDSDVNASGPPDETSLAGLARVAECPTLESAYERMLVVLAMNLPCWLAAEPGEPPRFSLWSEPGASGRIATEIAAYESEQALPRPLPPDLPDHPPGFLPAALWTLALTATFVGQTRDPELGRQWINRGEAVFQGGEWWRPFTALFLHADLEHLLGNLLSGLIFTMFLARTIGPWRAWGLTLLAGTLGNLAAAWLRLGREVSSLGASTAVFGALGLLAGCGIVQARRGARRGGVWPVAVPLVAGLVLLAWLGSGGERTDILAHLAGFACGLLLGLPAGRLPSAQPVPPTLPT